MLLTSESSRNFQGLTCETVMLIFSYSYSEQFNPLSFKSDQCQISPCNITAL